MKTDKTIAIICPIYPPHFGRATTLYNSFLKCGYDKQADMVWVFSNEQEAAQFKCDGSKIILPHELHVDHKGIINIKKFYAVNLLKNDYKYGIVIDSEAIFINNQNLYTMCEDFYARKELIGNKSLINLSGIINSCLKWIPNKDKIKNINLYMWFNQPCIYKMEYMDDFFAKTKIYDNLVKLTFNDFDYYIYMFYLIAYQNFKIIDCGFIANFGVCEGIIRGMGKYNPNCVYYMCTRHLENILPQENIFLRIHEDRPGGKIFTFSYPPHWLYA